MSDFKLMESEDDLRPHKRKLVTRRTSTPVTPKSPEITEIAEKFDRREVKKNEIRRRLKEAEKERIEKQKAEELKQEVDSLWNQANSTKQDINNRNDRLPTPQTANPRNFSRRYNNSRYFNWTDDENPPIIEKETEPPRNRLTSPISPEYCQFCSLTGHSKSAACSHVDHFISKLNIN